MAIFRAKNTLLREEHEQMARAKRHYFQATYGTLRIAVGSKSFVESIKGKIGIRAKGRKVEGTRGLYHLREAQSAYNSNFTIENGVLRAKNTYFWSVNS